MGTAPVPQGHRLVTHVPAPHTLHTRVHTHRELGTPGHAPASCCTLVHLFQLAHTQKCLCVPRTLAHSGTRTHTLVHTCREPGKAANARARSCACASSHMAVPAHTQVLARHTHLHTLLHAHTHTCARLHAPEHARHGSCTLLGASARTHTHTSSSRGRSRFVGFFHPTQFWGGGGGPPSHPGLGTGTPAVAAAGGAPGIRGFDSAGPGARITQRCRRLPGSAVSVPLLPGTAGERSPRSRPAAHPPAPARTRCSHGARCSRHPWVLPGTLGTHRHRQHHGDPTGPASPTGTCWHPPVPLAPTEPCRDPKAPMGPVGGPVALWAPAGGRQPPRHQPAPSVSPMGSCWLPVSPTRTQ